MTPSSTTILWNNSTEPLPLQHPTYIRLYPFERNFEFYKWRHLMSQYWGLCVTIVVLYVTLIHKGKVWMKNRRPYECRGFLIFWNVSLAIFSVFAFRRNIPEILYLWGMGRGKGFHYTVCSRQYFSMGTALWELIGIISKVIELGDTAFIVLRKQPLIFLHWYHHSTVLAYTWYTYESHDPSHRLFMTMNYFVHIFLYIYYAFKSLRYRVPRWTAMLVTSIQLLQMVVGIGANLYSLWAIDNHPSSCDRDKTNIHLALGMYGSYFVLFSRFFYNSYVCKLGESSNKTNGKKD